MRRALLLTLLVALAGCGGGSSNDLTSAERSRADAAYGRIARHCGQVASATQFVHGGLETQAERKAHASEREGVDVLLALHAKKPQAGFAPPGERIRPLADVLSELSKRMLFCDSVSAARISQALHPEL